MSGPFIRPDADRVGILKIPRVKLAIGAPGVDDGNISATNPLPVEPAALVRTAYTQSGIITINTVLATIDCQNYKSVTWHCLSMGTTGVVTPEWSSDGATDWRTATFFTPAGASATTFNAAGQWSANVAQRYLRFRLSTATTAGTTTINIDGCMVRQQTWLATQPVSGTVTANLGTMTSTTGSFRNSSADTNAVNVKNAAGSFYGITMFNNGAGPAYVKLYNKASAPTLASDTPVMVFVIPATSGKEVTWPYPGIRFATGISLAITGGIADTDTAAVAAGQVKTAISYV